MFCWFYYIWLGYLFLVVGFFISWGVRGSRFKGRVEVEVWGVSFRCGIKNKKKL